MTSSGYGVQKINTPPQISYIPTIQHFYYDYKSYKLPVFDPDYDKVECRWAANFTEGGGVWNSRIPYATLSSVCIYSAAIFASITFSNNGTLRTPTPSTVNDRLSPQSRISPLPNKPPLLTVILTRKPPGTYSIIYGIVIFITTILLLLSLLLFLLSLSLSLSLLLLLLLLFLLL